MTTRIGLISDTHGLLRPEATDFLQGCDHIIHAGDVGGPHVLDALRLIAPITVVRGNHDKDGWADQYQATELVELSSIYLYVVHDITDLDIDPNAAGIHVVVTGHSHTPSFTRRDGVLYINPGSAGPRRFKLPVSLGELAVDAQVIVPRLVELHI